MNSFDCIPRELKAIPRWLLWKRITKADGSLVKVPQNRSGDYAASAHAPSTWMTFDDAVRQLRTKPTGWGGIGFALRADDDIGVVDLDGCYDGIVIASWAQQVLDLFAGAYAELSPSGTGFHIFARGAPAGLHTSKAMDERVVAARDPVMEAFSDRQFITVTGQRWSGDGLPSLPEAWAEVMQLLGAGAHPMRPKTEVVDAELSDVADALRFFSSDDVGGRGGFVGIGLAVKDAFGDEGFPVWADWMARSKDDEGEEADRAMWDSFPERSEHISLASVFWRARRGGWRPPMDFDEDFQQRLDAAPIVDDTEKRRNAPIVEGESS